MIQENFIKIYEDSFKTNWDLPALSDYSKGTTLTYQGVAQEIAKYHLLFEHLNVKKGDKIALIGKDNIHWCIVYMATMTYGAVIVPILQDFNPHDVQHIINHSESVVLFSSTKIWDSLNPEKFEGLKAAFSLSSCKLLMATKNKESIQSFLDNKDALYCQKYPNGFTQNDIQYAEVPNSELVLINYTSGTTGFSKGVMLTANNLAGNVTYARTLDLLNRGQHALSFLPLAHAYGCAFNFLLPLANGVHIYLLGKVPTPNILLKAFADVKPNIVITVPLIIEKIYKNTILPTISKPAIKFALSLPIVKNKIYAKIRNKLITAMGGNFSEVIIGGAALNAEVEEFLHKIKFPFTVGYGMTECGPLISYDHYYDFIPTSCGQVLKGIMEVRIDSEDPYNKIGEIQVRGENVMIGYYKNDEATRNVFTEDGWLKTGDLGRIDADHRIYIRGRSKTMILSASGQNIFPEEIEAKLNNLPFVMESLVIERKGKLVALVYPDYEAGDAAGLSQSDLNSVMTENKTELNKIVAPYERIAEIQLFPTEFEKTPKKSIKRYLYCN